MSEVTIYQIAIFVLGVLLFIAGLGLMACADQIKTPKR